MTSTTNSIVTSNADGQFVDANSCFLNTNVSSAITSPVSSAPIPVITNSNSNNNQMQSPGYLDPYYQEKMNESKMNEPANQRNRSGSGGSGGPMSRVIDMFRGRSHSIAEGSPTSKTPSNKVR